MLTQPVSSNPTPKLPSASRYVLGFMLDPRRQRVSLIRKNKPAWQAGKLNGIGGSIEKGETPAEAMAREFLEETGVPTSSIQWEPIGWMQGRDFMVHLFRTLDDRVSEIRSTTPEQVVLKELDSLSLALLEKEGVAGLGTILGRAQDPQRCSLTLSYD
jgi:8-oxo-dGTP diphosphatase